MDNFTEKEAQFLLEVLAQIKVQPLAPDAVQSVEMVREVARKIEAMTAKSKAQE